MAGFFKVPNETIDKLLQHLKPVEFACLMVVIRKTRGWHKGSDPIALSQFQNLTGIGSKSTIIRALVILSAPTVALLDKRIVKGKSTVYALGLGFDDALLSEAEFAVNIKRARSNYCTSQVSKTGQVPVQKLDSLHGVACPISGHTKDILNKSKEAKTKKGLLVDNLLKEKPLKGQVLDKENGLSSEAKKNALARSRQGLIDAGQQCGIEPTALETVSEFQARLLSTITRGVIHDGQ